ncbi:MAG: thiamine diphosphokinase [Pseudomonadota bacterium]
MPPTIVQTTSPVVLLGAGEISAGSLEIALTHGRHIVAADGGAQVALDRGLLPDAVIGDFDSLDPDAQKRIPISRLHRIDEQDTTDFEKCLARISAPLVLAAGFTGARMDHMLAVMNVLVRAPGPRCIVIGIEDVAFALDGPLRLTLEEGERVSLFPLAPVRARSTGLRWPIDAVPFAPGGAIGTSNEATGGPVEITPEGPGLLAMFELQRLPDLLEALV